MRQVLFWIAVALVATGTPVMLGIVLRPTATWLRAGA